jgi:hypothetical protein
MWRIPSDSCRGNLFFLDFERGNMETAYRLLTLIMALLRVSTSPEALIPLSDMTLSPLANLLVGTLTVKTVPSPERKMWERKMTKARIFLSYIFHSSGPTGRKDDQSLRAVMP